MWLTKIDVNAPAGDLAQRPGRGRERVRPAERGRRGVQPPRSSRRRTAARGSPCGWRSAGGARGAPRASSDVGGPDRTTRSDASRPDASARDRGDAAVSSLLAGAGAADAGGGSIAAPAPPPTRTVHIRIHFSQFDPTDIDVEPGQTIRFVVENTDPIDHEFIVGDEQVQLAHEAGTEAHHPPRPGEISIAPGETVVTTVTFPSTGSVLFGCHLPGHYAYGMRGTITIAWQSCRESATGCHTPRLGEGCTRGHLSVTTGFVAPSSRATARAGSTSRCSVSGSPPV